MDIPVRHTLRPVNQLPMQNDQSGIGCSILGGRQMVQIKSLLVLASVSYELKNLCFTCVNLWLYRARLRMRRLIAGISIEQDSFVVANSINPNFVGH
ncbi:MAG: hypothetical protein JWM11_2254 [Planctomycetaceae bacterium]|nr:hypothetical protein [Planctomycetaceae bacterium]